MIRARMRSALPVTATLAVVELLIAYGLAQAVGKGLDAATGAGDNPFRLLLGLIEEITHPSRRRLLEMASVLGLCVASYGLAEPAMTFLFVRAHRGAGEISEALVVRRMVALLLGRLLVVGTAFVVAAMVGGFALLVHLATRGFADPRPHDLGLACVALASVLTLPLFAASWDRVTVRVLVGEPRPLEAFVDAAQRPALRVAVARVGLVALGLATFALEAISVHVGSSAAMALATALSLVSRFGSRSAYAAWLTERETRPAA